jgi:cysteine/O-acetylserine efflux protein
MGLQVIISFCIYSMISAFTPGPGNLLALNTIVRVGWQKGKNLLFGIFAGYYAVQFLCSLLVYGMESFLNPVMFVMKYIGAAYILWLAIHILISKPDLNGASSKPSFWTGFILQFVNVKIYLFGITALTGYVLPFHSFYGTLLLFELIIATFGTVATLTWAILGGAFQKTYIKHYRVINIILSLALLECAVSMLFFH